MHSHWETSNQLSHVLFHNRTLSILITNGRPSQLRYSWNSLLQRPSRAPITRAGCSVLMDSPSLKMVALCADAETLAMTSNALTPWSATWKNSPVPIHPVLQCQLVSFFVDILAFCLIFKFKYLKAPLSKECFLDRRDFMRNGNFIFYCIENVFKLILLQFLFL